MECLTLTVRKTYDCDVLVVGGGVAGLSAAVAAARQGAKVILCEEGGYLGGTATRGLVGPFMTCYDRTGKTQIIRGFFSEFVERMIQEGGAVSPADCHGGDSYSGYRTAGHIGVTPFSPEVFKTVAEAFCTEEKVKLLYHSRLIACETQDGIVRKAYFSNVSGLDAVRAKVFIDTTGSAVLAEKAGARTVRGDENGTVQMVSMFFRIKGVDKEALDRYMSENREMRRRFFMDEIEEGQRTGAFPCGTVKLRIFEDPDGFWSVNMVQEDKPVNELDVEELTAAEISQRKMIPAMVAFLKKNVPALKDIRLVDTASDLGVRESRRIVGKTLLTGEDICHSRYSEEQIAVCANSMDRHQPNGVAYTPYASDRNYYIPLSCLISADIKNLLTAGKTVSADRDAFAAIRVMPPCFAMGEAAGIAAAMAASEHAGDVWKVETAKVQEEIRRGGGYLE